MRVLIMKMINGHVQGEVKARETESEGLFDILRKTNISQKLQYAGFFDVAAEVGGGEVGLYCQLDLLLTTLHRQQIKREIRSS